MLTNHQLQLIIVGMVFIICLPSFYLAVKSAVLNHYWHSQIAGDDLDDEAYDINQENPFYYE